MVAAGLALFLAALVLPPGVVWPAMAAITGVVVVLLPVVMSYVWWRRAIV